MIVRQVANLFDLVEFFAEREEPASLAEICQHFEWPRSSTFNLLKTLSERGYLYEPEGRARFFPTPKWAALGNRLAAAQAVPEPFLRLARHLNTEIGETVCLGAAAGDSVVFLEVIPSAHLVRYAATVGQRIPLHSSGSGWAILSQWSPGRRQEALRKAIYVRYGPGSPTGPKDAEVRVARGLAQGWWRSASTYTVDLGGVTIPLVDNSRIFALSVAGPLYRMDAIMPRIAAQIHDAADRILGPDYFARNIPNLTSPPRGGDPQTASAGATPQPSD